MQAPDAEVAVRDAIRHWLRLPELAEFASRRHGFGDSDGGFGVTYPSDLDEYDREACGTHIPDGFVQVYGFWGPPDGYEMLVEESAYLTELAAVLAAKGHESEAAQVRMLAEKQSKAEPKVEPDCGGIT